MWAGKEERAMEKLSQMDEFDLGRKTLVGFATNLD
jgi:hypothetical protein